MTLDSRWHATGDASLLVYPGTPLRVMSEGSHHPVLCLLEDEHGPRDTWVVKAACRETDRYQALARERFGADVAALLGLHTPATAWLLLPSVQPPSGVDEASIAMQDVYGRDAGGAAFCSRFVDDAVRIDGTLKHGRKLPGPVVEDAIRMFALDVFLHHADRTAAKTNALARGERLIAIDHGLILAGLDKIDESGAPTYSPETLGNPNLWPRHFCSAIVRREFAHPLWSEVEAILSAFGEDDTHELAERWPDRLGLSTIPSLDGYRRDLAWYVRMRSANIAKILREARACC